MTDVLTPVLTDNWGAERSWTLDAYEAQGGYGAIACNPVVIGDVAGRVTLTLGYPGRATAWQWVDMKPLGLPGVGDYSLEVLADDAPVGSLDIFAREARLGPADERGKR